MTGPVEGYGAAEEVAVDGGDAAEEVVDEQGQRYGDSKGDDGEQGRMGDVVGVEGREYEKEGHLLDDVERKGSLAEIIRDFSEARLAHEEARRQTEQSVNGDDAKNRRHDTVQGCIQWRGQMLGIRFEQEVCSHEQR